MKTFFIKFKTKTNDYLHLLFKSAADNHFRIQKCIQNPNGEVRCDIVFDSFSALKSFQRKLRRITLSLSGTIALIVISTLVIQLVLPVFKSKAATYAWTQEDFSGGESASYLAGGENISNWTYYSSKDGEISADASGISLATASSSWTQTTSADFSAGTKTNVSESGGNLTVSSITQNYSFSQTNNSTTTSNPSSLSGGFNNSGNVKNNTTVLPDGTSGADASVKLTATGYSPGLSYYSTWNFQDTNFDCAYMQLASADLDNDGDFDLMVGCEFGIVRGFRNTGSSSSPSWSYNSAWNTPDIGLNAAPALADLDNDGDQDLLIGNNAGTVLAYKNTGSASSPTWTAEATWNLPDIGSSSDPVLADLDNDGDKDVIIGRSTGTGVAYKNTGSASSPTWMAEATWNLPDTGDWSAPSLADLDNDGDLDAMIGDQNGGRMFGYKNTGSVSGPVWTAEASWNKTLSNSQLNTAPTLADLDNDGDKDMLIGTYDGYNGTSYYWILAYRNTQATNYNPSGTYTSYFDGGLAISRTWSSFSFISLNGTGNVAVDKVKSSDDAANPPTYFTSDGTSGGTACANLSVAGCVSSSHRYLWYQATLTAGSGNTATPELMSVSVQLDRNYYNNSGSYVSKVYDTLGNNSFGSVTYNKTTPGDSSVTVKARTCDDSACSGEDSSKPWSGCSALNSGNDLSGGCVSDGERYVQYQVTLNSASDLTQTPTFSDITVNYNRVDPTASNQTDTDFSGGNNSSTSTTQTAGSVELYKTTTPPSFSAYSSWDYQTSSLYKTAPFFADLDGDSDFDMMVGEEGGQVKAFRNTGSSSSHSWSAQTSWDSLDVGSNARPVLADLDNDGDKDLLIGKGLGDSVAYKNTGSASSPTWTAEATWNIPDAGSNAAPALGDLDGDGDLDALVGLQDGTVKAYENTNNATSPVWAAKVAWNPAFDVYDDANPALVDLDNDGDLDLMVGSYNQDNWANSKVYGYKNNSSTTPSWSAETSWDVPTVGSNTSTAPALADLDNDSDKDLFFGSYNGTNGTQFWIFGYKNNQSSSYASSGTFTSGILGPFENSGWGKINWTENSDLGNTDLQVKVRTCNDASCSGETAIASCSAFSRSDKNSSNMQGSSGCMNNGDQYIQYQAILSTTNTAITPQLNDIYFETLSYANFSKSLTSSWINTKDSSNAFIKLIWKENSTLPSGTNVKFQVQSAVNNDNALIGDFSDDIPGTQTGFVGSDGTDATFFVSSGCSKTGQDVTCSIPANIVLGDAVDDHWLQYKIFMETDNGKTPTVSQVQLQYVVNGAPVVSNVSAYQDTDGIIKITNFDLEDDSDSQNFDIYFGIDTGVKVSNNPLSSSATSITLSGNYSNLPTGPQVIQIDNEQISCTGRSGATLTCPTRAANSTRPASHNQNSVVWFVGSDANTTGSGLDVATEGTGKSGTWDIVQDLPGVYSANAATLRVIANDGQSANQISLVSGATSSAFTLDTADPEVDSAATSYGVVQIDGRRATGAQSDQVKITAKVTDEDSNLFFRYSLDSTLDGNGELSSDGINIDSGAWLDGSDAKTAGGLEKTISLDPSDNSKQDSVYVQFKDQYNNVTTAYSVSTPERPTAMMIQDITNTRVTPNDQGLFISWKVSDMVSGNQKGQFQKYVIEKAQENDPASGFQPSNSDFSFLSEITDKGTNFYVDRLVPYDSGTKQNYYYRVYVVDGVGNYSYYSATDASENAVLQGIPNGTQDPLEGGGGSASSPNISHNNGSQVSVTSNSATITWTVDQDSDSAVDFVTASQYAIDQFSSASTQGVATFIQAGQTHSVTISDLNPDTTYNYRLKSTNSSSVTGIKDSNYSFTTLDGVEVLENSVQASVIANNSATITWKTDKSSDSYVVYSNAKENGSLSDPTTVGSDTMITDQDSDDNYLHSVALSSLTENTPYYFYVKSTDGDGVMDDDRNNVNGTNEYYSFNTDFDNTAPSVVHTGVPVIVSDAQAVIRWTTDEKAKGTVYYRKQGEASYSSIQTDQYNREGAIILGEDEDLDPDSNHEYYLTVEDINANASSSGSSVNPHVFKTLQTQIEHAPLDDPGNPTIANLLMYNDSQVVISWATTGTNQSNQSVPTLSDAKLCYAASEISDSDMANDDCVDSISSNNSTLHIFNIENLTEGTVYHYRIKTTDDKDGSVVFTSGDTTFSTSAGGDVTAPTLSADPVVDTNNTSATLTVSTSEDAIVFVEYLDTLTDFDADHDEKSSSKTYKQNHTINLASLTQNKVYYFKIKLQDEDGNTAVYDTDSEGNPFIFSTEAGPELSDIDCSVTQESITLEWETDENSDSYVIYSENSDLSDYFKKGKDTQERNHSVTVSGLLPQTEYYYKVSSENGSGGQTVSDKKECPATLGIEVDAVSPEITSVKYVAVGEDYCAVYWKTDEDSTSKVNYGTDNSYGKSTTEETDMTKTHIVMLKDLSAGTTYHYQVVSKDSSGNIKESDDYTCTTLGEALSDNNLEDIIGASSSAPDISSSSASVSDSDGAIKISWKTDKESNSLVAYRLQGQGNYKSQGDVLEYVTDHTVILKDLAPNTTYQFYVISADKLGNTGKSGTDTFTTQPKSDIFNVEVVDLAYDGATISWETSVNTTSLVEYGEDTEFSKKTSESDTRSKAHAVKISGLDSGKKYYYRVKGKDSSSNMYSSSEYTFSTPAPPEISDFKVDSITEHKIKVSFKTNIETDSFLTLAKKGDEDVKITSGDPKMKTEHKLEMDNLEPGTTYTLEVQIRDKDGNSTNEKIDDYTTAKDENPPKIDQIRTDAALTQSDKVQAIISWVTDEPANTALIYREGKTGQTKEVEISPSFSNNHVAVTTTFKPGTVYYIKVKSKDQAGNESISSDHALLTPRRKENIVQIIIGNFEDIFKWAKVF